MKLEDCIGNTPLVELRRINPNPNVTLLAKLEGNNPGGSLKDRPAYNMIKRALERKTISSATNLIEPTSGNTGIALAMVSSIYDLKIQLVMPENSSIERVKLMESYGAEVVLTLATEQMEGSINYVRNKLEESPGYYHMLDQFSNPDNVEAHVKSTGPEIWKDTKGKVTHFVSAMGTTGTITGVSAFLKGKNSGIQVIGAQPGEGSSIPGIRKWPEAYRPKIYTGENIDLLENVSEQEAIATMKKLAEIEGLFCGPSSGGAAYIALNLCEKIDSGTIVFIVCDRGDRYLSMNY